MKNCIVQHNLDDWHFETRIVYFYLNLNMDDYIWEIVTKNWYYSRLITHFGKKFRITASWISILSINKHFNFKFSLFKNVLSKTSLSFYFIVLHGMTQRIKNKESHHVLISEMALINVY